MESESRRYLAPCRKQSGLRLCVERRRTNGVRLPLAALGSLTLSAGFGDKPVQAELASQGGAGISDKGRGKTCTSASGLCWRSS